MSKHIIRKCEGYKNEREVVAYFLAKSEPVLFIKVVLIKKRVMDYFYLPFRDWSFLNSLC